MSACGLDCLAQISANAAVSSAHAAWVYTALTSGLLVFAGVAAFAAFRALKTWREQISGSYEFDTAMRAIAKLKNLDAAIGMTKSTGIRENEDRNNWAHDRRIYLSNAIGEFQTAIIGVEDFWGDDFKNLLTELFVYTNELALAINYIYEKKESFVIDSYFDIMEIRRRGDYDNTEEIKSQLDRITRILNLINTELQMKIRKYLRPS